MAPINKTIGGATMRNVESCPSCKVLARFHGAKGASQRVNTEALVGLGVLIQMKAHVLDTNIKSQLER